MTELNPKSPYMYLRVLSGPHKGEVYKLSLNSKNTIGRDHNCIVSLNKDDKISRKHAEIFLSKSKIYITNLNPKNKLLKNQKVTTDCIVLKDDVLKLGSSQFRIAYKNGVTKKPQKTNLPKPPKRNQKRSGGLNPAAVALIVIIIGLGYMFLQPEDKSPSTTVGRKVSSTAITRVNPQVIQKMNYKPKDLPAQAQYIKGFRDFKKGQYERGLLHFQRCLALAPNHTLCRRYLGLSRKKIQELIQYHVVLGRKYKDQKQYKSCSSAFKNVTFMVKDPSQKIFQEATKNYKYCEAMLEGSF